MYQTLSGLWARAIERAIAASRRNSTGLARQVDELTPLLESRAWMRRRVDRLRFIELTTIHRTSTLSLDVEELAHLAPGRKVAPIGLFRRNAGRAGTRLVDAE